MWFFLFIFIIILIILFYYLNYKNIKNVKEEYINGNSYEYYDKYVETISVPVDFYNITAELPSTHYAVEMNDRFFLDALNKNKIITSLGYELSDDVDNQRLIDSIIKRTNNYLASIFNKELQPDEKFLFANVYTEKILAKKIVDDVYLLKSKHIIYRDTKIYGVSMIITTLHSFSEKNVKLIDYQLIGFVFEDKVKTFEPENLIYDDYQDYNKDKVMERDPKYENKFLCKYFNDLFTLRGIQGDIEYLNCPATQDVDNGVDMNQ